MVKYTRILSYTSQTIEDIAGGNGILYISKGYETVVVLFCKDESDMLKIKNIKRFNPNGVFTGESTSTINFDSTLASESTSSSQETNPLFDNLANTLNEYTHSNTNSNF